MAASTIVFMGSPPFVVPVLRALYEHESFDLALVVTAPPHQQLRRGRILMSQPTAVAQWVRALAAGPSPGGELELRPLRPQLLEPVAVNHRDVLTTLRQLQPDLIITAAYGQILSEECLAIPTYGVLNIHPSKLPAYRGATPIQAAIMNGDTSTAVSFVKSVMQLDAGRVISWHPVAIEPQETAGQLLERIFELASGWVVAAAQQLLAGATGALQDEAQVSYCAKLTKASAQVHWDSTAERIFNQYRALDPWPGCYTFYNNKRVKLQGLAPVATACWAPAEFGWDQDLACLTVGSSSGDLAIGGLTMAGKKLMDGQGFWHMVHSQPQWPRRFHSP